MLLFCRNGFEQQTQSTKSLLSPQYHVMIIKLFIFTAKNPSHFVCLILKLYFHSYLILYLNLRRDLIKFQIPENKEQSQVTFNTNNSPHWALTFSFFDTTKSSNVPCTTVQQLQSKSCGAYSAVHPKLHCQEHQQEQTAQRHFSHVMSLKQSVLDGHMLTKVFH